MKKITVGITGQSGIIETYLSAFLRTKSDQIDCILFNRESFQDKDRLTHFVSQCDFIVHLAGMFRGDPGKIYDCNISLANQLIHSLESGDHPPHIIYISSIQETRDNSYGRSKYECRKLLETWAKKNNARVTSLVIPHEFGPFGKPYYNSVVSTFSYQLTHNLLPKIETDAELDLVYAGTIVGKIYKIISGEVSETVITIPADKRMKVSDLLLRLQQYKQTYFDNHIFPDVRDEFDAALFNTFRSFIDQDYFPVIPPCNRDERGYLIELVKESGGGQTFFSVTKPGITRGNHFHIKKIERFCVVAGEALIELRRIGTDSVISYHVDGTNASFIDIPVFYTHCITNTGNTPLTTVFWANEIFDPRNPDTCYENVHLV
ncbi:NAD-dependent epimerase/dehydratase family protein [uncultured Methanoregula sp.]|uniref:polysaccharide biosynthesis C-terminal domain-containing protein n=1 Tax=uncultured Methanoregula sp. TaxID=1005933 RepID=UPI002AAAA64A|nr:NAD-dependent epimerase/dehydratase family protein [uncultured Methanoregula sp.]